MGAYCVRGLKCAATSADARLHSYAMLLRAVSGMLSDRLGAANIASQRQCARMPKFARS
jgi:nitrate/nitrite transporter NarK